MPLEINSEWIEDALIEEEYASIKKRHNALMLSKGVQPPSVDDLMMLVKENIIRKTLLRQEAAKKNYKITEDMLVSAYKQWQQEVGVKPFEVQPSNKEEKEKVMAYLKSSIGVSMLIAEVLQDLNPITPAHVKAHYEANLSYYHNAAFFSCKEVWHATLSGELEKVRAKLLATMGQQQALMLTSTSEFKKYLLAILAEMRGDGNFSKDEKLKKNIFTAESSNVSTSFVKKNFAGNSAIELPGGFYMASLGWHSRQGFLALLESDANTLMQQKYGVGLVRKYSNGYAFYVLTHSLLGSNLSFNDISAVVQGDLRRDVEDGKIDLFVQKLMASGKVVDHQEI